MAEKTLFQARWKMRTKTQGILKPPHTAKAHRPSHTHRARMTSTDVKSISGPSAKIPEGDVATSSYHRNQKRTWRNSNVGVAQVLPKLQHHTLLHIYPCIHMHTYIHAHIYPDTYTCTAAYMITHTYTFRHAHIHTYSYAYTIIYTYTHVHLHTNIQYTHT